MREQYKTRQKEIILEYLKNSKKHLTADDVVHHFRNEGVVIGKATVYRHLEKLTQQNIVLKYSLGNGQSACYQYVAENTAEHHYHLICVDCGKIFHEKCGYMDEVAMHLKQNHEFEIEPLKTILYGRCKNCKYEEIK